MTKMKRYPAYKPTGIPWLPEVPEGWEMRRVGRVYADVSERGNVSLPILSVSISSGVSDKQLDDDELARKVVRSEDKLLYKHVSIGDLAYNQMRAWQGAFGTVKVEGLVSPAYVVCRPRDVICSPYIEYLLKTPMMVQEMKRRSTGIVDFRLRLYWSQFKAMPLVFPPLPIQRAIVAYLDEKCGRVDRLVAAKEKEVALLKELKQSMIAEAVCGKVKVKGEGEQRKMKPSGIQWLPEVPEGWEVKKVRQHFRLRAEKVSEKACPPLSVAKIGVVPQLSDVALSMAEGDTRKLVRAGDYVVNSRSDRKGSCGIAPRDGSVTTISIVLEPRDIERKFVHYLFRSTPWVEEFYRNGRGIVADLWTTRYQEMRNMMFPLPPLAEQRAIVAYIEARAAKIDAAVAGLEREVAALKEYKQRLIADVVTGQRKVA